MRCALRSRRRLPPPDATAALHYTVGLLPAKRPAAGTIERYRLVEWLNWALAVQGRTNHNKATCALANKLARICYAALRDGDPYTGMVTRMQKKVERTAYAMPA